MYEQFSWTDVGRQRNAILEEYEPLQPHFLVALAQAVRATAFLDIGANIGTYSLFMSLVPSIGHLHAFEANPPTADELDRNLSLNRLANPVTVHRCALSDAAGDLKFGIVNSYSGANAVLDTSFQDSAQFKEAISVEAKTLDSLLPEPFSGIVAVKLDVEGHELMVIRGGHETFAKNRVLLQVELYPQGREQVVEQLAALGYRRLLRLGPDHYFTNVAEVTDAHIAEALERASDGIIERSHLRRQEAALAAPASLRLPAGVKLQFTGRSARLAKRMRELLRGRRR
ncbi:MAG TPA: FkbM family methyltransferase [Sphingomonadaceae bacterium]